MLARIGVSILVNYVISTLFAVFSNSLIIGIASFIILVGLSYYIGGLKRRLRVLKSGMEGYYYTFPPQDNIKYWKKEVTKSFCYLGISSATIITFFEDWVKESAHSDIDFKFLLMKPDDAILKAQECFKKEYDPNNLTPEQDKEVSEQIKKVKERIFSSVSALKTTRPYKENRLQIKYHTQCIPFWMYVFDDEKAYVGVLPKKKEGLESPLLILKRHKKYYNTFTIFYNLWQKMWQEGIPV
ncbi:MAG: hypothetical protein N2748_03870 [candidate division WOR-3 bacterium]|nr:hypothetical protein [candidate division WOR-3 bacterium]